MINYYTVRTGETIRDVCLNATGTIDNWEAILTANNFSEWVPTLTSGQKIIIPDTVEIQNNVLVITTQYPANNDANIPNLNALISDLISKFGENWILTTGQWDDTGFWLDQAKWID